MTISSASSNARFGPSLQGRGFQVCRVEYVPGYHRPTRGVCQLVRGERRDDPLHPARQAESKRVHRAIQSHVLACPPLLGPNQHRLSDPLFRGFLESCGGNFLHVRRFCVP